MGRLETCKFLVEVNADVTVKDRFGIVFRTRACVCVITHPPRCRTGHTPLKDAIARNETDVVAFLRSIGAPE